MQKEKIILAIVGLPGAGKSEATEFLANKTVWPRLHFGQIVFDEVKRRGLELNEHNEREVRENLRAEHGMGAMASLSLLKINELFQKSSVLVESLYSWEEYVILKKEFGAAFKVLAVYASPDVRGIRLGKRTFRPLNAEEFQSRDFAQIENLHQAGPIARADFTVINEGSLDDLHSQLGQIVTKIL